MKFVLFLATALFGQSISLTTDNIMPEKDVRTGEFNVSFTIAELLGETSAKRYESIIASDETVEWEIFVPESYEPENPAGILVYISPSQTGRIPNEWKSLIDEHNTHGHSQDD